MPSKEVARQAPAVPDLAPTPATTITADDIIVPRLYVGNYMSDAVKRKRVDFGDVYLAEGPDDTDPEVLWAADSSEPGVLAHVLHLRKGLSYTAGQGAPLQTWAFDSPDAHPDAWTSYHYTLFLPDVDPEMPAKLTLAKSGKPVARRINTVLGRADGAMWTKAFRITSAKRQKDQNEWAIFQAAQVDADPDNVLAAGDLFTILAPGFAAQGSHTTTGDEPEI